MRFVALFIAFVVGHLSLHAQNYAPADIKGRSLVAVIESGSGGFASVGGYRIKFAPTGNTYQIESLSYTVPSSSGSYLYSRLSGTSGRLTLSDSLLGGSVPFDLTFSGPTTAKYSASMLGSSTRGTAVWENVSLTASGQDKLINLSVLTNYTGANSVTFGFVVAERTSLLLRAVGPGLQPFKITGMADPRMKLNRPKDPTWVAPTNDNWGEGGASANTLVQAFDAAGAFGLTAGSKDAAMTAILDQGDYTVTVEGTGGNGPVLVEVYRLPE